MGPEGGTHKRFRMPVMEGAMARSYARLRRSGSQIETYREQAAQLTDGLGEGADVLEVAPGPGYLAIEIARLRRYRVTGLDISRTFVRIAADNARQAAVDVDFRQGDVEAMPFGADSFDLIVCQAAFKNFARPLTALDEMCRVLRPGGTAVIQDMNREASGADIDREVRRMALRGFGAVTTKWALTVLRLRALSPARFQRVAAGSAFRTCDVLANGLGIEARLRKPPSPGG
jgi:ubiquinone/menaquinone biosynthesis C-methylase UbiE